MNEHGDDKRAPDLFELLSAFPAVKRRLARLEREGYLPSTKTALWLALTAANDRHGSALDADALDDVEFIARSMVSIVGAMRSTKELTAIYRRETIRVVRDTEGRL